MRVHVKINQSNYNIDEVFEGASAEDVVGLMKARVAKELSFALRIAVNAMGNLTFAQEIIKRLNAAKNLKLPIPTTCAEFLEQAQQQGIATVEP